MREVLYEESLEPKNQKLKKILYYIFRALKIVNIIATVAFAYFAIFLGDISSLIFAVSFAISSIMLWQVQRRVYYCVDCIFVSGSTRLIKVINYKSRKSIIIFDYDKVEQNGKVTSASFERLYEDKTVKKIYASPDRFAENSYYVFLKQDGEKFLVILNCTENYLKNLVSFTGSRVVEKDYQ